MHLLTGMIIAALMGKGKSKPESPLLGPTSPVRLTHSIPGRARYHLPVLRNAATKGDRLADQLRRLDGVASVTTDHRTGSVTIAYDTTKLKTDLLAAAMIRLLGLESRLGQSPQPALVREVRRMGGALNHAVYAKTGGLVDLWTLVPLTLAVLGVRKLMTERTNVLPTGVTLLWWAYSSLFKGERGDHSAP
ncbi:hypothetical protein GF377_01405 [candidate division GN15 bacterium]|nr:hypothetical protein [candidate division GN15 bacterium]